MIFSGVSYYFFNRFNNILYYGFSPFDTSNKTDNDRIFMPFKFNILIS